MARETHPAASELGSQGARVSHPQTVQVARRVRSDRDACIGKAEGRRRVGAGAVEHLEADDHAIPITQVDVIDPAASSSAAIASHSSLTFAPPSPPVSSSLSPQPMTGRVTSAAAPIPMVCRNPRRFESYMDIQRLHWSVSSN